MSNIIIYLKKSISRGLKKENKKYKWIYDESNYPLPNINSSISRYLSCAQRYFLKFWEICISLPLFHLSSGRTVLWSTTLEYSLQLLGTKRWTKMPSRKKNYVLMVKHEQKARTELGSFRQRAREEPLSPGSKNLVTESLSPSLINLLTARFNSTVHLNMTPQTCWGEG